MQFSLTIKTRHDGVVDVYTEIGDEYRAYLSEESDSNLVDHTFEMRTPTGTIEAAISTKSKTLNPLTQKVEVDPDLYKANYIALYIESWTLEQKITVAEVQALHPQIQEALYEQIRKRVFPSLDEDPDFLGFQLYQQRKLEAESTLPPGDTQSVLSGTE